FLLNNLVEGSHYGCASEAAKAAGYEGADRNITANSAAQLLRRGDISNALRVEGFRLLYSLGPTLVEHLLRTIENPKTKESDRIKAIRVGLSFLYEQKSKVEVEHRHQHQHRHELSADEVTRRIVELAAKVGIDAKTLPPTIEATAIEVMP